METEQRLNTIPADHRAAASSALEAAFGSDALDALQPVAGGASGALLYRVDVHGKRYLLRIETRQDRFRNPHQYVCMQTAADAGIAPPLLYVDSASGVAIMEFIENRPLAEYPGGPAGLARGVGSLIAQLQTTKPFPELRDYLAILDRMVAGLRSSGRFAPGLLDPHAEAFERIRQAYPWDRSTLVSSHNDPNPHNIIFDGRRLWLVDWETAYRNDPMTDVAIVIDNLAPTPDLQHTLLEAWIGRQPDRFVCARLVLMRPLTRLYYAGLLLGVFAGVPRDEPDGDLAAPGPEEFRAAIANGRLKVGAAEMMRTLGKMFLAGFLSGASQPEIREAIAVVQGG